MKLRFNRSVLLSIAISIFLHALFFAYSGRVWLKGVIENINVTKSLFDVRLVKDKKPPIRSIISKVIPDEVKLRFEKPVSESIKFTSADMATENIEKEIEKDIQVDLQPKESQVKLPEKRPADYSQSTELEEKRRSVRQSVLEEPNIPQVKDGEFLPESEETVVPKEFTEQMPGFTPIVFNSDRTGESFLTNIPYQGQEVEFSGQDQYLVAQLATYKDASDGKKYFKIILTAGRDAKKLEVIPKEILFLVDCSLSTQEERMANFKKGLLYCLNNLNKDDIFNIISFRDKIQRLNVKSLRPDSRVINASSDFINSLEPSETTDVYRAFEEVIKTPPERHPSYIVLLSDGKPSVGIIDSRKIISSINRINKETRSIFCYSAGTRVNRYLLDFIAYRNRGWSEYSYRSYDITKGLQEFYNKIKDPILLNLRYRFSQLSSDEIYPKSLPDFYKGAAFTIFGTYEDEDEFSMQLLGESKEYSMEFIFSDSLKEAPVGDKEISRQWAFNKIYYLIGKLAETKDDQEIISEINNLCEKFDIKTPYSYNVR